MTCPANAVPGEWISPVTELPFPKLKVLNTLTKSKVELIPQQHGKRLRWYSCGPTVYDASHMGHARNYITIDILRRILEDYFGYEIQFIMNITDIDDKIIVRGRHRHLIEEYRKKLKSIDESVIAEVTEYWKEYVLNSLPSTIRVELENQRFSSPVQWMEWLQKQSLPKPDQDAKFAMIWKTIVSTAAFLETSKMKCDCVEEFLSLFSDILGPALDHRFGQELSDPKIFRDLSAFWEADYLRDMDSLSVKRPSVLTRVSEYIPEIIQCIQEIDGNGYAYERNGSVYFDTKGFDGTKGHRYAKLCPNAADRTEALIEEAEGALSLGGVRDKKNSADFALWKKSKPGEPAWDSPWGKGRPGWAIECSAMASSVASGVLDIHSGGIDLAFPHHDNELAQSEGQYECTQWVNYFFHIGHLHIEGQKMSKSLKNFVTIKAALEKYTSRQMRLLFLSHSWHGTLDFKETSMREAIALEAQFIHFFDTINALVRANQIFMDTSTGVHYYQKLEVQLASNFTRVQDAVHAALCDSFDTPSVLRSLVDLMTMTRNYIKEKGSMPLQVPLLQAIGSYLTRLLKIFGLMDLSMNILIGFPSATAQSSESGSLNNALFPYLQVISSFRDALRGLAASALSASSSVDPIALLNACDNLRDTDLYNLGVVLEDREGLPALVKMVDKNTVEKMRAEKFEKEEALLIQKQEQFRLNAQKLADKLARASIQPINLFRHSEDGSAIYSRFDDLGIPTHDILGEELPKNRRKKLVKEYEAHVKLHTSYSEN